jgi:hypothetical protein
MAKSQPPYSSKQAASISRAGPKTRGYEPGRAAPQVSGSSGKGIEKCHCSGKPGMYGEMSHPKGRNQ